jgi:hypothetical protein
MKKLSALILALVAQSAFAAGATPESTAAQLLDPAKAADVAKDPKAAVAAMTNLMDPATAIIMMQKSMDPATFTKMAQAGMSPDILKSYAAFLDPNMYTKWLAASMDPQLLHGRHDPLHEPQHVHEVDDGSSGSPRPANEHGSPEPQHVHELGHGSRCPPPT